MLIYIFFFSSRRRHTRLVSDWSSDVCSSDLSITRSTARRVLSRIFLLLSTAETVDLETPASAATSEIVECFTAGFRMGLPKPLQTTFPVSQQQGRSQAPAPPALQCGS